MAQTKNLGKVALTPKGVYNPGTAYKALDVVRYAGSGYLVLKDVVGVTPVEGEYYMLLVSKGDAGATGQAATVAVGSVSSVPYGTTPTITNVGTPSNAVFDFEVPQGPAGDVSEVDGISATSGDVKLSAVRYVSQSLTTAQKTQARTNIGAMDASTTASQIGGIASTEKGATNGVATLGSNGKITPAQATSSFGSFTANRTIQDIDMGKVLKTANSVTVTFPAGLSSGFEVEIWNTGSGSVTLSGTLFVAGSGDAASATLEAYSVCGAKFMDSKWYITGGVSV